MLDLLALCFWVALTAYVLWFLFRAKTVQPLTLDDLALAWKLHKQKTGCKASNIHTLLVKNNEAAGFRCECGYDYLQKRLISQKIRSYTRNKIDTANAYRITGLLKTNASLEKLSLSYSKIKEI